MDDHYVRTGDSFSPEFLKEAKPCNYNALMPMS